MRYKLVTELIPPNKLMELIVWIVRLNAPVTKYRSCTAKKGYETLKGALKFASEVHGEIAKVYHCKFCQGFHITTGPLKKETEEWTNKVIKSRKKRATKRRHELKEPWWKKEKR